MRGGRGSEAQAAAELRQRARDEAATQQRLNDWRELLRLPAFRRVVQWTISKAGTFDTHEDFTARKNWLEGKRALGVEIANEMCAADAEVAKQVLFDAMQDANPNTSTALEGEVAHG